MNQIIIDYLLFIGMGLYALTAIIFAYLFYRTTKTIDGVGLTFLKILTLGLCIGSFSVFTVRFLNMFFNFNSNLTRALAIINPITLLGVGLYLNFLFHQKYDKTTNKGIKKDS